MQVEPWNSNLTQQFYTYMIVNSKIEEHYFASTPKYLLKLIEFSDNLFTRIAEIEQKYYLTVERIDINDTFYR